MWQRCQIMAKTIKHEKNGEKRQKVKVIFAIFGKTKHLYISFIII